MADVLEVELTGIAHGGSAFGRCEGRIVFVPYTIPGERVRVRIMDEKPRYAHGEAVEILKASPARLEAPCPHFGPGLCGGCQFQHVAYQHQLELKRQVVLDQLRRIGRLEAPDVLPTIPSPVQWHYRSHSTFTMSPEGRLGFYSDDGRSILPVEVCHILHPALLELFQQLDLDAEGIERVKFQVGSDPADRMLVIQTTDDLPPEIEVDVPVSVNLLLSDNEPVNLVGSPQVVYQVLGRDFRVTAGGFFQVNLPVAAILVEQVLHHLAPGAGETVLDLYSGVGLFTAFIAERAGLVVSVESYPPAASDAEVNLADLENVEIIEGPVEAVLEDLEGPIDAIVLDPPRTGVSEVVVKQLGRLAARRIVYVSCDPATLARDVHQLAGHGYRLRVVQPVDMFPQTYHIETVAVLGQE